MKRNYLKIISTGIKHEQKSLIAPGNKLASKSKIKIGLLLLLALFSLMFMPQQAKTAQAPEVSRNDATNELILKVSDASVEEIIRLIKEGADVNVVDKNELIPFSYEENSRLTEDGVSSKGIYKNEKTPLMYAAKSNSNPEVLRVLIEGGADVNAATKNGWTPLIYAVQYNSNPDVIRVLIEGGADVDVTNERSRNDLYNAISSTLRKIHNKLRMVARVSEDIDFNLYHPWSSREQLPRLNAPASLLIRDDYPKLDGATLAYPIYAAIANEIYAVSDKSELEQYLACSKTSKAYSRLINGETDVIFVLQPSDEQLQSAKDAGVELHFTPIAKDAFVFFVNDGNPVSNLSIEQIRDIYLEKITNWNEVGGHDKDILAYQRQENSGSQTAMIKEVMRGEKLPSPPKERTSSGMMIIVLNVAAAYRNNEFSIGYSFRFFTEEMMRSIFENRVKAADYIKLLFSILPTSHPNSNKRHESYQNAMQGVDVLKKPIKLLAVEGVAPNEENLRNGTYPLMVDLYAVTAGSSNPHIQELITWLLSPQGQELIEKTGFVGVKRTEY